MNEAANWKTAAKSYEFFQRKCVNQVVTFTFPLVYRLPGNSSLLSPTLTRCHCYRCYHFVTVGLMLLKYTGSFVYSALALLAEAEQVGEFDGKERRA